MVPLLPIYAHDLGAGGFYISMIFGAFSISRTVFVPLFGKLSDTNGRKPFIVFGLLGYALISVCFMLSENIETLIGIRFLQGVASAMIMPVIQAYVGDLTAVGKEGVSMGLFNMSVFIGLSFGPFLGGLIKDYYGLNTAFACMGIASFIAFLLSGFLLPRPQNEIMLKKKKKPLPLKSIAFDPGLVKLFIMRFSYVTCIGIIWSFLPIYADESFSLSSSAIGILVMIGILVSGAVQTPMGILADHWNKEIMVILGGITAGVAILLLKCADGFWGLFAANLLFGIGGGISMPAIMALAVIEGNRTGAMGSVMSVLTMAHSSGMLFGSVAAGLLMEIKMLEASFIAGSGIMIFSVCIYTFFTIKTRTRRERAGLGAGRR